MRILQWSKIDENIFLIEYSGRDLLEHIENGGTYTSGTQNENETLKKGVNMCLAVLGTFPIFIV